MCLESYDSNGISEDYRLRGLYRRNSNGKGEILIGYSYSAQDMVLTYIHEMMHAYYDASILRQTDIEYAEEPLAELGKLRFCEDFDKSHPHCPLYDDARRNVENKQYTIGLGHYGFGLFLMDKYHNIPWENILRSHYHLLQHNKLYQELESSLRIYPSDDANARRLANILLQYILDPTASKLLVPMPKVLSRGRITYPWYRGDIFMANGYIERPDEINPDVVNFLVNQIPSDYFNGGATFLDPFEKDSPFLEAIANRLMIELKKDFPNDADREKHIWKKMLFSCDSKDSATFISDNKSSLEKKLTSNAYSVIIGVPPFYYQKGTSRICMYLPFIEKISQISREYHSLMLFLTPTNWYMGQDRTCALYRKRVIRPQLKVLCDFYQTKEVFPNENFMGGVAAMTLIKGVINDSYKYKAIPKYQKGEHYQGQDRIWTWSIDDLMRRGVYYHEFYSALHRCRIVARCENTLSIQNGGYSSWSIKNTKHPSKGYVIQYHTPGQQVPKSNFVVNFDPNVFNPQAVEKYFQTKLVRYLVSHECPTTSWGIPRYAFDYIPIDLLLNPNCYLTHLGLSNNSIPSINWSLPVEQVEPAIYSYFGLPEWIIDIINHEIN